MLRFFQTFCEIEIQQTDGINRTEMEIPVTSTLSLLTDRKGGVIDGAVFEELLIHILHLDNKLLALLVLAIDIKDGAPGISTVAQLLRVEVSHILNILFATKQRVEETYQQLLVELGAEKAFETEISMWVDVSFCHNNILRNNDYICKVKK